MIKDRFGRQIDPGDEIVILSGAVQTLQVVGIQEPSPLTPPDRVPVGTMALSIAFELPLIDRNRSGSITFTDIVIVRKITDIPVPPGTTKQ